MTKYLPEGANYELRVERKNTSSVKFDGNKFESIDSSDEISQTVRLLKDGKLSIASGSKPDSGEELIKQAITTVPYGSSHDVPFVGATNITPLSLENTDTLSSKEMVDIASELMTDLRSLDDRLSVGVDITSSVNEVSLQTSNGFDHSYRKSTWSYGGSVLLTQGDDSLGIYEHQSAMGPAFDLKGIKDTIARKLEYAKNVVPFNAGAYPVIFAPGEVNYIINPVVSSLNGMAVYRQVSPWGDKLGQELLDPRFTLIDDGSLDNEWTSKPFDVEGTPTGRNVLVQNGCINTLLLNRKVGALLGKESSGNASPHGPSPNHLRLSAGTKSLEELISSIDYGILIYDTMGSWSGNPFSGIVTGTISMGLAIQNGKITGRVKDCMYTINAFEHLRKHLVDFSSEVKSNGFMSYNLFPYVMLDEVVISTK